MGSLNQIYNTFKSFFHKKKKSEYIFGKDFFKLNVFKVEVMGSL